MAGENCSSGCETRDHPDWGACVRDKNTRVGWAASASGRDLTKQKKFQAEIDAYRSAYRQGIRPDGSKMHQIRKAVEVSDKTGQAYVSTR